MAVTVTVGARQRSWRGYDDPGLPVGMWFAWVVAEGDASGGDQTLIIEFDPVEIAQISGRFWNVEALEVQNTRGTTEGPAALHIINFAPLIGGAAINRMMTVRLVVNELAAQAIDVADRLPRPIFLGTSALRTVTASIRIVLDNSDTFDTTFWAEGYIWEGRSVLSQGGLRRPVDSLYG